MSFFCSGAYREVPVCDYKAETRWTGPCPGCGRFYSIRKYGPDEKARSATLADAIEFKAPPRIVSGLEAFDKVLNGGIVVGSTVVLSGQPGLGKSTLLMQVADGIATETKPVLYISGEQSKEDLLTFAQRIGIKNPHVHIRGNTEVIQEMTDMADEISPCLIIIDSVQTSASEDLDADYGSDAQVKAVANWFTSFGKKTKTSVILVCQVNKEGDLAGPKTLEHLCDGIIYLDAYESEDSVLKDVRVLTSGKHRNGPMGIKEYFEMSAEGCRPPTKRISKIIVQDTFE